MANLSEKHYLTPLFEPSSVADIGATERQGSVGAAVSHTGAIVVQADAGARLRLAMR